jgi:hypothetical protein
MAGRTIAIGDIHGCSAALAALLDAIEPGPGDTFVPLGDYIDREEKGVRLGFQLTRPEVLWPPGRPRKANGQNLT